jgi:DNA-binding MarR family transcriptional regulator
MEDKLQNYENILEITLDTITNFVAIMPRIAEIENMHTTEFYVFLFIGVKKCVYNSQVASALGIKRSSVSMILRKLVQKNLIELSEDEIDRRYTCIYLSKRGREIFLEFLENFSFLTQKIMERLDKNTLKDLNEVFHLINSFSRSMLAERKSKK